MRYRALSNLTVHGRPVLVKHNVYSPDELLAVLKNGLIEANVLVAVGDASPAVLAPVPTEEEHPAETTGETTVSAPKPAKPPKPEQKKD